MKQNEWSVFLSNRKVIKEDGKKQVWIWEKVYNFYKVNMAEVDVKTDVRFKLIKDKREESIYLGVCETEFPVKFPLTLINGVILEKDCTYHN